MTTMNTNHRIVVLVDMDCFFCQVEVKFDPKLKGKPLAVVQYNQWQSGGIIAVNYEAREHGVSRHMRAEEAKQKCPDLLLASVPGVRGKPDTSRYRLAGREVVDVLQKHSNIVERASVDEAYLDITDIVDNEIANNSISFSDIVKNLPNTFVVGYTTVGNNDEAHRLEAVETWVNSAFGELEDIHSQRLAVAGVVVERIRADIYSTTGYRCSAGISYNKILAKLACGLHKPNRQTILTSAGVSSLFLTLPVKKVRNLGGKFGDVVIESLGCNVMADLLNYSLKDLQNRFDEKNGSWLYNIARGIDNEQVTTRLISKSIGCCKNFPGKQAIVLKETLEHWVKELSTEMSERLEQDLQENNRKATLLTISYHFYKDKKTVNQSRSCRLRSTKTESIMKSCLDIIYKFTKFPIIFFGMSASKFIDIEKNQQNFKDFFTTNTYPLIKVTDTSNTPEALPVHVEIDTNNSEWNECNSPSQKNFTAKQKDSTNDRIKVNDIELSPLAKAVQSARTSNPVNGQPTCNKIEEDCGSIDVGNTENNCKFSPGNSPMSLLRHKHSKLKPDNFKKSFFMNMWNTHKHRGNEAEQSLNNEQSCNVGETVQDSQTVVPDIESDGCLVKSENTNYCENVMAEQRRTQNNNGETTSIATSTITTSESSKGDQSNVIQLQDIFPDLNNIDESVVALLPSNLQKEAQLVLTNQRQRTAKSIPTALNSHQQNTKEDKLPNAKSAASKSVNKIDTFFNSNLKAISISDDKNGLGEKCLQCDKIIPLQYALEHADFHVAQNLSKEINSSVPSNAVSVVDKKASVSGTSGKRKRNKNEMKVPQKRTKSIATFFS